MKTEEHIALQSRFEVLVRLLGGRGARKLFARLVARYGELHRHYHDLAHIRRCLDELDQNRKLAVRPAEVEAAIFYHDAIYDSSAGDNEEQSARLAEGELTSAGVPPEVAQRIADLIRATDHREPAEDPDAALLVDIDLAGLADTFEEFAATGRKIRLEFAHISENEYKTGRREFFQAFLARPAIYSTEHYRDRLETRARENLRRLIG